MKVNDYINQPSFSNELVAVHKVLSKAQSNVTFWGKRVVTVAGYEGSISLDELAKKVLSAARKRSDSDDLTTQERVAGIEITKKLNKFYEITDTKISQRNWFTWLLNKIREFSFVPYTTRFYTEESMEHYFRGYSESKFKHEFGGEKKVFGEYKNSDGSFGPPLRITAPEAAIRAKLAGQSTNAAAA